MTKRPNHQKGLAALFTIVVVSAVTLILAYGASLLGLGELDLGYTSVRGTEAFSIADGCLEEVLRQTRLDPDYGLNQGFTINLTVSNGSCTIVFDTYAHGSPSQTITVLGTTATGNYNKKIRAQITLSGSSGNEISMSSWEERSD